MSVNGGVEDIESNFQTNDAPSEQQSEIIDSVIETLDNGDELNSKIALENSNSSIESDNNNNNDDQSAKIQCETNEASKNTLSEEDKVEIIDNVVVNLKTFVENALNSIENLSDNPTNVEHEVTDESKGESNSEEKSSADDNSTNMGTPVENDKNNNDEANDKIKSTSKKRKSKRPRGLSKRKAVTPRRRYSRRRRTIVKSYNEDILMQQHIKECLLKFYLEN